MDERDKVSNFKRFIIAAVPSDSRAMRAGLQAGDVVYQINDIQLRNVKHGLDVVAETTPGSVLNFIISRSGQQLTLPVTIIEVAK